MIADFSKQAIRAVVMVVAVLFLKEAHSASVEWNKFYVTDWDSWWPGSWTIDSPLGGMAINSDGDIAADGSIYSSGYWASYWVYASAGDCLARFGDYAALPLAADLAFTSETAISGDNINAHRDSDGKLYLAVIGKEGQDDPKYYYGWVYLQDKTILESALSEMPLIVGTGQVIPEPSSAWLLILGIAGLALKGCRTTSMASTPRSRTGFSIHGSRSKCARVARRRSRSGSRRSTLRAFRLSSRSS